MSLEKQSPCKVNLVLNILGKRPDGFHELETLMHPVKLFDLLAFDKAAQGIELTCNDTTLPTDSRNLAYRAAQSFLEAAQIKDGVRIHLDKRIPIAAGLGGGSGNAATVLLGLNELFGNPLPGEQLHQLAAALGSDIPFFLQSKPALATGRGEQIQPLELFPAFGGMAFLLIYPGFGIATAWAYQQLRNFPTAMNGSPGRAQKLASLLERSTLPAASKEFYNSLEAPALLKYPFLSILQDFLRASGAVVALMSGSGSTTFAICETPARAEALAESVKARFGANIWQAAVPI